MDTKWYEDGDTTLRKICSAADFVWSGSPLEILGSVSSIKFEDPACFPIKDHILTTEEVTSLCDDLRVLGKQDFKHLLKWRMQIRKALSPSEKATSTTTAVEREGKEDEDEDERILNEMEELTNAMEQKKKRAKKILAKRQAKRMDTKQFVIVCCDYQRVNFTKLGTGSLWRYWRSFNLASKINSPTKEQLVNAVEQHFSSQEVDDVQVIVGFIRVGKY